jgi:hypothetical protein
MVVKIKPKDILENEEVKSFYEKQEELINEIRESIKVNGLRNPLRINYKNILLDGHICLAALKELGRGDEEIDVIRDDVESTLEDYLLRNSGRTKTDNDLVKEWRYIFFEKFEKRQGRKRKGLIEGTYAENVSRDLGGRFKDDETINKIGFCLKNDLPDNLVSKGIIKGTISPVNGYEFLKTFHPIDINKKYGITERMKLGELSIQDGIKMIKSMDELDETYSGSFVIPDKCHSYNIDCVDIEKLKEHHGRVDLVFTSIYYWLLRYYDIGDKVQPGQQEQKEEFADLQTKFTKEFENLANKIFEEKSTKFTAQNKKNMDQLLNPLQLKILNFEKKVDSDTGAICNPPPGSSNWFFDCIISIGKSAGPGRRCACGATGVGDSRWSNCEVEAIAEL